MPKRTSKKKETDINILAKLVVDKTTLKPVKKKNPAAVALGRLGGLKGGISRAKKLTPKRRKEIAQQAAKARWNK